MRSRLLCACALLIAAACARDPSADPDGGSGDASSNRASACIQSLTEFCQSPSGTSFPAACPATLAEALRAPLFCRAYTPPEFARRQTCGTFQVLSVFNADRGEVYFFDAAENLTGIVHFIGTRLTCLAGAPGFRAPYDVRCTERTAITCAPADASVADSSD
jgi:hypothetical protein